MSTENFISLYKDEETLRLDTLRNICRMLINRGRMDRDRYLMVDGKYANDADGVFPLTKGDDIDVTLFNKFISKRTDDNTYKIEVDVHFSDERIHDLKKGNTETPDFDGSVLLVKIIRQKITDINSSPVLNDFLKVSSMYRKLIICDNISDKAKASLRKKKNLEFFERESLLIDLMSHLCSPIECRVIKEEDLRHIINPKIAKILENDAMAKYYCAKKGDIIRIVRSNPNNGVSIGYRRVIDPKPAAFK